MSTTTTGCDGAGISPTSQAHPPPHLPLPKLMETKESASELTDDISTEVL